MAKIHILAPGTLKETYWRDAIGEYTRRLTPFCQIDVREMKESRLQDHPSAAQIQDALEEEGRAILEAVPPRSALVALCIEGKLLNSEELSAAMEQFFMTTDEITFVIGSSYGLSDQVKQKANLRLSLGRMTFPHQMVRVMLHEIIYRCFTIQKGLKYHK